QKIISIVVALVVFIVIVELVRRKKLMEEFSWIWLLAGVIILLIAVWEKIFFLIANLTGIIAPSSIVFFFGIIFLILITLQLAMVLSKSRNDIKNLAQKISLYENELEDTKTELNRLKGKKA
ncbi:MAG: DUF2304 domain-containing protein, partial [Candidatus Omnitrophica bacterium]|nr:DUF2304 domain-containing protein [Candidatus Omnitrophota bacterium]